MAAEFVKTAPRERLLLGLVAGGFWFLAVDTVMEHLGVFASEPLSLAPPLAATVVGLLVTYAFLAWTATSRKVATVALWLAVAGGALGFVLHNLEHLEHGIDWAAPPIMPPVLAPLGFIGLATFGLVALWPRHASPTGDGEH